jgi:hypothetical protein
VASLQKQERWYETTGDVAASLFATARRIARDLNSRRKSDELFTKMYGSDPAGLGETTLPLKDSLKYNICRSLVNTAKAHIGAKRPRPRFVTNDADWSTVQAAKACEHVVDGEFRRSKFWELAPMVFTDGAVSSLGAVHVYDDEGIPRIERVYPGELLVDVREGYHGAPRNLYRAKAIPAAELKRRLRGMENAKELAGKIDGAAGWLSADEAFNFLSVQNSDADMVVVIEAWHLPDGETTDAQGNAVKGHGGRHVIACSNAVLLDEAWDAERFPFAVWRWEARQFGWYGLGMVEQARQYQRGINYLDMKITDALHTASRVYTLVGANSGVKATQLSNDPAVVIEVTNMGEAPRVVSGNAVPPEWFARRREIIADCYAEFGFSEMMATGTKPAGLDSGEAQREFKDTASERIVDKLNSWDEFVLDVARLVIDCKTRAAKRGEDQPVTVRMRRSSGWTVKRIKWGELNLDEKLYELECTPSSMLPDSSAGRLATATDWFKAGLITQVEFKYLMHVPDLERFKSLDLASYEIVLDSIERMIEDGEAVLPEPTDDLELVTRLSMQSLNMFRLRGVPEKRLNLVRNYMADAQAMAAAAANQNAQSAMPAAPAAPAADPMMGAGMPAPGMQSPQLQAAA